MKTPPKPKAAGGLGIEEFIGGAKTAVSDSAAVRSSKKKTGLPAEGVIRATIDLPISVHEALKIRGIQGRPKKTMRQLVLEAVEQAYGIK